MDVKGVGRVTFVACMDISENRKAMGWKVPKIEGLDRCRLFLKPDNEEIESLLSDNMENTVHLFSGIRGFEFVFNVFKKSLEYSLVRGLIVERPNMYSYGYANGKPLWLHRIAFRLRDAKFRKYIKYVFAMGEDAVEYYKSLCNDWKVYPFAYCTEIGKVISDKATSASLNCLFIGSLVRRKSVSTILTSFTMLSLSTLAKVHLKIIGDGAEREMLRDKVENLGLTNVEFMGSVANDKIGSELAHSDVLILPSIYDGWGAVVNEALCSGCYAIVSDRCGAKELLHDKRCGKVFGGGNPKELALAITDSVNNISDLRSNRTWRKQWAKDTISGNVLAQYMVDALNGKNPPPSWF